MGKLIFGVIMAMLLGIVLYPAASNLKDTGTPQQFANKQPPSDTQSEITLKQALVNEDVRITEELSRQASMNDAALELIQIQDDPSQTEASIHNRISAWLGKHPNVTYLQYGSTPKAGNQENKHQFGEASPKEIAMARDHLEEASNAVVANKSYASPRFQVDDISYFAFGLKSTDEKHFIIGLVKQDILQSVKNHQMKNMRLEPFQSERKLNVKTVEPGQSKAKTNQDPDDKKESSHYEKMQVVVKFRKSLTSTELGQILSQINGNVLQKVNKTYIFKSNKMDTEQLIHYFRKWHVEYAEPHYLYMTNNTNGPILGPVYNKITSQTTTPFEPNDNLYSRYQWNLRQIGTDQSWQENKTGNDVIVAVIDTGVDLTHPDIKDHLLKGYNVVKPDESPEDDVGHGTHVAGVISAVVNNHLGIAGMTLSGRVLPIKALDETGAGSTYSVAQGIIWATDHGAKVINMSLGNYATSSFLHDAIRYAYDHDVVLIAASGNDNTDRPSYPAYYPEVFAVAASDASNKRATFSNYGEYIDVAAPGVNIASTYPKDQYVALSGTSMATPHVAALAAILRATNPSLKNTDVMDIIRSTAQDIGEPGTDTYFGHGLINVPNAVKAAQLRTK